MAGLKIPLQAAGLFLFAAIFAELLVGGRCTWLWLLDGVDPQNVLGCR